MIFIQERPKERKSKKYKDVFCKGQHGNGKIMSASAHATMVRMVFLDGVNVTSNASEVIQS